MAQSITPALESLLLATNLGRSQNHPLAGWLLLSMLYRDGSTSSEPMTMNYLVNRYNAQYLQPGEPRVADETLRGVMKVLVDQAHLVTSSTRRVRERMSSGKYHTIQSAIYRIDAAGIEFLRAMQRVVDAESTVIASTKRIGELVGLVKRFVNYETLSTRTTELFEDFNRLLSAYDAVMNGLRKLDVDLHEITTDLAFDRAGTAAGHLRQMLHQEAIPAYRQMIHLGPTLQWLKDEDEFAKRVAQSRQGTGNLDAAVALADNGELELQRHQTKAFVKQRLTIMSQSFDGAPGVIQASFDSIYLLYQTLIGASDLLAREYEHVHAHSIDIQALTSDIDQLLTKVHQLKVPQLLPDHLPMDRLDKAAMAAIDEQPKVERAQALDKYTSSVRNDLLEAGSMEPVTRSPAAAERVAVSEADNPAIATDVNLASQQETAMAEFAQLVGIDGDRVRVEADIECQSSLARDAIVGLYPATQYQRPEAFSAFGRIVEKATVTAQKPIQIHLAGESYVTVLPHGFEVTFTKGGH